MDAKAIRSKLNKTLTKFGPNEATVYKRAVSSTSGNAAILGRKATGNPTDTFINPQPKYTELGERGAIVLTVNGDKTYKATDYRFVFSPDQLTREELEATSFQLVLKFPNGTEQVCNMFGFQPEVFKGEMVAWSVFTRGKA